VPEARRWTFLIVGGVALALGTVGLFLPLVPTVPFLLLAGWAFARSSPRLERWLTEHPRLGPPVKRWREHGVVSRFAKVTATVWLAVSAAVAWGAGGPAIGGTVTGVCALVALFLWTRPSSPRGAGGDHQPAAEAGAQQG
jgi:uncharacterized protein